MVGLAGRGDVIWRATTYVSVAQLHLVANPLLTRPLVASDIKERPSGHWGTVPGTAWALTHVGLVAGQLRDIEVIPVLGAGHAGIVQLAVAWLSGDLQRLRPQFSRDARGLEALVVSFPTVDGLGSEVHPGLMAGAYLGGWLGGALAFAQGFALDAAERVVVPILGDGECETPTTAAAWLAQRTLACSSVLPIVHLNGYRMGGRSLLSTMSNEELGAYASGLGWQSAIASVESADSGEHESFHDELKKSLDAVMNGIPRIIFMRCRKGWSGPVGAHKTPLHNARYDRHQREDLEKWLSNYVPGELFNEDGAPAAPLAEALDSFKLSGLPSGKAAPSESPIVTANHEGSFSSEVGAVLEAHSQAKDFRIFSPDEMTSNRLSEFADSAWVHEILAEEVLFGWLTGWTASGRRGVLISYEAFSLLGLTGLMGQLKQRRLAARSMPSINILLTSYGWHNTYTHGDPSLITALLATNDHAVRVYTPADAARVSLALSDAVGSVDRLNVIIAGKHRVLAQPMGTIEEEREEGLAVWPHLSDSGNPDLILACAGDLAAAAMAGAIGLVKEEHPCRIRVVNIHELTSLAGPKLFRYVGDHAPVLIVTLGHKAAIWGLLDGRLGQRAEVIGWREPPHPMSQSELASYAGLNAPGIARAATALLEGRRAAP